MRRLSLWVAVSCASSMLPVPKTSMSEVYKPKSNSTGHFIRRSIFRSGQLCAE